MALIKTLHYRALQLTNLVPAAVGAAREGRHRCRAAAAVKGPKYSFVHFLS